MTDPNRPGDPATDHTDETDPRMADAPVRKPGDRIEAYRRLARRYDREAAVMLPAQLWKRARRLHVRACLIEDHADRIDTRAEGTAAKFDKLAGSLFSFFRGTALLFYRDMAGADPHMPTVLLLGDVHPLNFGVMPNVDNVPIFSVNDFDEVLYGPFTWDLKRGAAGFAVAAKEIGGEKKKHRRKIVRAFVQGYLAEMRDIASRPSGDTSAFRLHDSPDVVASLIEDAMEDRADWLRDRYLNEGGTGFRTSVELTPVTSRRDEFQAKIDRLAEANDIGRGGRLGDLRVKDVALRHGQGTASLGLDRYYVLIAGPAADGSDDVIVEFKRARRSALSGLVPENPFDAGDHAERIAHGQGVHLVNGDVFYGSASVDGESFMTRERASFRDDADLAALSTGEWRDYAHACGRALAMVHARSSVDGAIDYELPPRIVAAIEPEELFVDDLVDFSGETVHRLKRDHASFCRDHALGAFARVPRIYR